MSVYSKDEITKFFKSTVNLALKEFKSRLEERGWDKGDIQSHDPWF